MKYKELRIGQAFQFFLDGDVYIRCRGGYRPGIGGKIAIMFGDMPVILFKL